MRETSLFKRLWSRGLKAILILGMLGTLVTASPPKANAVCYGCQPWDPPIAQIGIQYLLSIWHALGESLLKTWISNAFTAHRNWLTDEFLKEQLLPAMMRMTEQMSAVGMQQVMVIGMFLDAKNQLETQRLFQELQTQAHRDYQPSEDFCWFGTNVRSMAASEQKGRFNSIALTQQQMQRQLKTAGAASAESSDQDKWARWRQFTDHNCDPSDNNYLTTEVGSGLRLACPAPGTEQPQRYNRDVNYTRMIEEPKTVEVDLTSTEASPSLDEQDVLALSKNLYGHDILSRGISAQDLQFNNYQQLYMAFRSVVAKRNVALNSFNAIVGLKSSGTSGENLAPGHINTSEFLTAVLVELGVPASEAYQMLGGKPSYYAQLEILAKKIYQNPDFYANLYDKPANVQRKSVALKAIELMLDRAIYESQLRQEMSMSVLLSTRLRDTFRDVNKELPAGGGG